MRLHTKQYFFLHRVPVCWPGLFALLSPAAQVLVPETADRLHLLHNLPFQIEEEQPGDVLAVSRLSAVAFGPGRFARSAYRLREEIPPIAELCLVAKRGGALVGSIRFTALRIGGRDRALLLGPLAITPDSVGTGVGRALITEGMTRAKERGFRLVVLVGDVPYYGRFGFAPTPLGQFILTGPADPARLLVHEVDPGALADYRGRVEGVAPPIQALD